jgi:hypothetical protein
MRFILSGKGVPPSHYQKQKVVKDYAKKYALKILIETGTYLGKMIKSTLRSFTEIYSNELDPIFYERAKRKFAKYNHIHIILGDSGEKLKEILEPIQEPVLYWLDAHYFGGITGRGIEYTPIIREIRQILEHKNLNDIILIDDARLFDGTNDYPTLEQLKAYVDANSPNYNMKVEKGIIILVGESR